MMNTYIYLLATLGAILTALIVIFFILLFRSNLSDAPMGSVHGSGGIDVDRGQMNGEEIHGYRGISKMPTRLHRGIRAREYLEESLSSNQFRADLGDPVIIGRLVTGNTQINNLSVSTSSYLSRQHARLIEGGGIVYLENISKFGTKVNGMQIQQPTPLYQGDIIVMGDVQLRVLGIEFYVR